MTDTLRSIAEGMEHGKETGAQILRERPAEYGEWLKKALKVGVSCRKDCNKCRLEALLAEYEKVDLVRKWHELGDGLQCDHDDTCCHSVCAAELETWLAVNLERIKARARLEGEISEHKRTCQMYWHVGRGKDLRCSEGYACERLAALEAQA